MLLWMSQCFSQAAERLFLFVVILVTYLQTRSSFGTSVPALGFGVPAVLFGSMVGVYVDRQIKRQLLMKVNVIRACLILSILFIFPFFSRALWAVFIGTFLLSMLSQLFIPAETTLIARTVAPQDLVKANSIFIGTFFGMGVLVFALASRLAGRLSVEHLLLLGAVSFLCSSWCVRSMKYLEAPILISADFGSWWIDYTEGLSFAWNNLRVRRTLVSSLVVTTIFSTITVMGITFADQVLHWQAEKFGYLALIGGVGMALGMYFVSQIHERFALNNLMLWGFAMAGVGLLIFAQVPELLVRLFGLAMAGYGSAFVFIPVQTILQKETPAPMQARILAIQNMILNFSLTLPILLLGRLADIYGVARIFASLGVFAVVIFVLGLLTQLFHKGPKLA